MTLREIKKRVEREKINKEAVDQFITELKTKARRGHR